MSEVNTAPQGKGLAVTGFVLSLVGLIFTSIMAGICLVSGSMTLLYVWLVLCLASIILSVMGMSKLGKTGGKKGLGIAGMIIGIVATVYCIFAIVGTMSAIALTGDLSDQMGDEFKDQFQKELQKELDNM